jgi:hypothetical protein
MEKPFRIPGKEKEPLLYQVPWNSLTKGKRKKIMNEVQDSS